MRLNLICNVWAMHGTRDYSININDCSLMDRADVLNYQGASTTIDLNNRANNTITAATVVTQNHPFHIEMTGYRFTWNRASGKECVMIFISAKDVQTSVYHSAVPGAFVPEMLIVSDMRTFKAYRVFTIFEASSNYRGIIMGTPGVNLFWINREPEINSVLSEINFDTFKDITRMFKIDFLHNSGSSFKSLNNMYLIIYNFFASIFRNYGERYSLLAPIAM